MTGDNLRSTEGNRSSRSSSSSSSSSSPSSQSVTRSVSHSPRRPRGLEVRQQPHRSISFDSRYTSDDKKDEDPPRSRSPSAPRRGRNIETPHGLVRRDTLRSLSALSTQSWPGDHDPEEPTWPQSWKAYVCLFGGFLLMFNSWGIVNTYGTYASYYTQDLLPGRDIYLFNLIGSTQSFIVLLLSAPVGRFLDAGYIRHLLVVGTLLLSIGSFTLSVSSGDGGYNKGNYGLIWLTQGLISGLGMACFFVSSSQVVATWFKAKKGLAIGIVASGASISGLLYPLMSRELIGRLGFNIATRWVATVITLTCVLAIFIARPNPEHITRKPDTWFSVKVFWDVNAFKNRGFAWLVASIAFLFFGFYAIFFNLEEWAVSAGFGFRSTNSVGINEGIPQTPASGQIATYWLLAIMNACSTVGRVGSAYLCDHFGALNVHCAVTFIASLLTLILWTMAGELNAALAFVVVFGAFSGAVIGLPPASVAYILGPHPRAQAKLGQWTGMMYSCAAIFALTGPIIAGHMISHFSTFLTVQLWSGGCMTMSAFCMACAIYCRRRADQRARRAGSNSTGASTPRTEEEKEEEEEV